MIYQEAIEFYPSTLVSCDSYEGRFRKAEALSVAILKASNFHTREILVHGVENNLHKECKKNR